MILKLTEISWKVYLFKLDLLDDPYVIFLF